MAGLLANIMAFWRDQFSTPKPLVRADLSGKTVLVVGANVGLGFEAAKHFAEMQPARLVLACRSEAKGREAVESIKEQTGFTAELWLLDLTKFSSIREFADRWEREGGRLDILVENAAIGPPQALNKTGDGWEITLQVNHLAPSLHALLLLPYLIQTAKEHSTTPRLVVVSSGTHYWPEFDKEVMQSPNMLNSFNSYDPVPPGSSPRNLGSRYPLTKLLNVFFVRALNDRLPTNAPTIITNSVDPAFCHSSLRREVKSWGMRLFENLFAFPTEVGSRQLVFAALGEHEKIRGGYISLATVIEPNPFILRKEGQESQDRLWKETIEVLSKVDPRVQEIVDDYLSN